MELRAGQRLGKYEVVGRLAAGGMAEVYLARSLGHGGFAKTVALKRMLPELAAEPGFREMFMQEAALAARLSHAHIVQIFDFAEERGELYIAMEYVHGTTLRRLQTDLVTRRADGAELRVSPILAGQIARCVARALSYAWQVPDERGRPSRVIHRDVTPHNILLSYEGDAKLADFGIAKPADRFTSAGTLKGKLLYMAPEQLDCGPVDARTDVFALGIVLYELALGRATPLFEAATDEAVQRAIRTKLIAPPERMDPEFPRGLSDAIMKALEREPERRFQTAAEFADALGEAVHKEAKGPQDYDLAAFMRRVYGEPPPIPVCPGRTDAESAGESNLRAPAPDVADDPRARTPVAREERSAPAPSPRASAATVAERVRPTPPSEVPAGRQGRRWGGLLGVAAALALSAAGGGIAAVKLAERPGAPDAESRVQEGQHAAEVSPAASVQTTANGQPAPASKAPGAVAEVAPAERPSGAAESPAVQSAAAEKSSPHPAAVPAPAAEEAKPAAAKRMPPAAAVPREPGTLRVVMDPWAFAWLDEERFTGRADQEAAPTKLVTLPPGPHRLHLQTNDGWEWTLKVLVKPGQETRIENPPRPPTARKVTR